MLRGEGGPGDSGGEGDLERGPLRVSSRAGSRSLHNDMGNACCSATGRPRPVATDYPPGMVKACLPESWPRPTAKLGTGWGRAAEVQVQQAPLMYRSPERVFLRCECTLESLEGLSQTGHSPPLPSPTSRIWTEPGNLHFRSGDYTLRIPGITVSNTFLESDKPSS